MRSPVLSIIMIVYNSERYVADAICSITNQTFENYEFIIIDDGSNDNSSKIIKSYADRRIRLLFNRSNRGVVYSRNRGLQEARGEYIGMHDSDDIALPDKFEEQIKFLEKNRDFGMIGSWVQWIDVSGKVIKGGWKLTAPPEMIPPIMLFRNYFLQSAVLYRSECISNYRFQEGFEIGEDYKLWLDIISKYRVWNLQKYLVKYRIHSQSLSGNKELQRQYDKAIFTDLFRRFSLTPTDREMELHLQLKYGDKISDFQTLISVKYWLERIIFHNRMIKVYDQVALIKVVFDRWLKACYKARSSPIKMAFTFAASRILRLYLISLIKSIGGGNRIWQK